MITKEELKFEIRTNPFFRFFAYPWGVRKRKKDLEKYYASGENKKLLNYKGIHSGERCFIVGNGPSINAHDLNIIKNEITFGVNTIYKIFDRTEWRPTYYVASDSDFLAKGINEIKEINSKTKFLDMRFMDYKEQLGNCVFICSDPTFIINIYNTKAHVHEDVTEYFSNGETVTFTIMQLAIWMGFKEIYMIGQDFNMPYYKDKFGIPHRSDANSAHFKNGDIFRRVYLYRDSCLYAYKQMKKYCEEHDIIIKNATRGGKLEVFERATLEDLIN